MKKQQFNRVASDPSQLQKFVDTVIEEGAGGNTDIISQINIEYDEDSDSTTITFPKNVAPIVLTLDSECYYFDYNNDTVCDESNEGVAEIIWIEKEGEDWYDQFKIWFDGYNFSGAEVRITYFFFNNFPDVNTYIMTHQQEIPEPPAGVTLEKFKSHDDEGNPLYSVNLFEDEDDNYKIYGFSMNIPMKGNSSEMLISPRFIRITADEWVQSGWVAIDLWEEKLGSKSGFFLEGISDTEIFQEDNHLVINFSFNNSYDYPDASFILEQPTNQDFMNSFITTKGTIE